MMDIDQISQEFLGIKTIIDDLTNDYQRVNIQHTSLHKIYDDCVQSKKTTSEELKKYHELIKKYQKMLEDFSKTKDENNHLREDFAKIRCEKSEVEQNLLDNNDKFRIKIEDMERKQRCEIEKVNQQADDLAQSEISIYKNKLKDVTAEIEETKSSLIDKKRQHELEIDRLKLEFNTKIQKIQHRQISLANNSSSSMSSRNDIFRKKLQNLQYESDKELKVLKEKCNSQMEQLSNQQHQLKLQNKQLLDQSKKHQDQMDKQQKLFQQAQIEIHRLQDENQEYAKTNSFASHNISADNSHMSKRPYSAGQKRKKTLFNPHKDRLSPS